MNRFVTPLDLRSDMPPAGKYTLLADLVYESQKFGRLVAPAGLVTDFASIPRIAFTWLDPEAPVIRLPSVIHDYLYSVSGRVGRIAFTREMADEILRESMLACGARFTQAAVVHRAVRLFGGSHWKLSP